MTTIKVEFGQDAMTAAQNQSSPNAVAGATIALAERAAIFENAWPIDKRYLASQFNQTFSQLTQAIVENPRRPPRLKYLILFAPRSGSTFLTEILTKTGKLGYPIEYFVPEVINAFSQAFSDTFDSYETFIMEAFQTPNGVFGIEIEGERLLQHDAFFADMRDWKIIYINRRDILRQAISYLVAIRSGEWHRFSGEPGTHAVLCDRVAIVEKMNFMLWTEQTFETFLKRQAVTALRASYEDWIEAPLAFAARIADHIGVEGMNFTSADFDALMLKPNGHELNRIYALSTIKNGGEFGGFNLLDLGDRHAAVLAGLNVDLLSFEVERPPVLFIDQNREVLRARVEDFIEQLS